MTMSSGEVSGVSVAEWLERVRAALPDATDLSLSADEEAALLDLARIAAHASHRTAAPLTTFLIGIALGRPADSDRLERLRSLAAALEE